MKTTMEMNSRERVLAVFDHKPYDVVPAINPTSVATIESMEISKAFFPYVHNDAEKMAALAATGHDILGFDSVMPYFSVLQEAAALGSEVDWGGAGTMPVIRNSIIEEPDDFSIPPDFLDRKPVKTVIDAIKILRKKYGREVAVIGKVIGPWTLSYNLHGLGNFLEETILEPQKVRKFLNVFKNISIMFAKAQFEAGADIVTWADHATGDLVSAETYRDYLMPVHMEATRELREYGRLILHTCGRTTDRMEYFIKAGFDAFHFDSRNDLDLSMRIMKDRIIPTGCVNNPQTLLNGSAEDVRSEVKRIMEAGVRLVSPECAIPCLVPNRNLIELTKTAHSRKMSVQ